MVMFVSDFTCNTFCICLFHVSSVTSLILILDHNFLQNAIFEHLSFVATKGIYIDGTTCSYALASSSKRRLHDNVYYAKEHNESWQCLTNSRTFSSTVLRTRLSGVC